MMFRVMMNIAGDDELAQQGLQQLDHALDVADTFNGPGAIFAQVFPHMTETGRVLSISMQTVVVGTDDAKRIKSLMQEVAIKPHESELEEVV